MNELKDTEKKKGSLQPIHHGVNNNYNQGPWLRLNGAI